MERLGRCQVLIALLVILTIGIDESEEVSAVVEDRNGDSTTTTTVNVDNPTDCDKVLLIIVTGSGLFNYVIANGNTGSAFTTAADTDSGDEKLQCNMATIRTNAIASYSLSITVTDTGDSSTATTTVTVTVENLVIPSAECDHVPSVLNGSIVGGDQSPYVEGQNVTYNCTSGYTINGTTTISCNGSGVWSETPSCLKDCDSVPSVLNAEIVGGNLSSYVEGHTLTYSCTNGFTMMGTPTITCDATGAWTVPPSCQKDIGSACSSDAECQNNLHTPPYVCDNTVCKFGVRGSNCTVLTNSCLTNGRCSSDACECVDGFDPVDNKCYELILQSPNNGSRIEICETTEINEVIANLSASFAPTSTDFVFNISDPSNNFAIADDTIMVVSDLDVDVETPVTSYVFIIELSHPNSSRTASSTITIRVEDDNDNAPEFSSDSYTFDISEQSTASTTVGMIAATDKDSTSPNNMIANYTVIGTNAFEITSDGVLRVSSGASFNYTTTPFYTFFIMAMDGALEDVKLSTNVSVTVNIIPVTTTTRKTPSTSPPIETKTHASTSEKDAYIGGGVGAALVLIIVIIVIVVIVCVRRGERADDEYRCLTDVSGQYKSTLPLVDIQAKEGQENRDIDDPKNLNDNRAIEIHQNESPLSEADIQTTEGHESSDNDDPKNLNEISAIEKHQNESPLSVVEIHATEGHESSGNDDPNNKNDIGANEKHQNLSPLSEVEIQENENHGYSNELATSV